MALEQQRPKRKATGSLYKKCKDKRKKQLSRQFSATKVGEKKIVKIRTLGGNGKNRIQKINYASILDNKTKKIEKMTILKVLENSANRHYVRMGIITKGSIVELENGKKARITSSPGQHGTINGIILE